MLQAYTWPLCSLHSAPPFLGYTMTKTSQFQLIEGLKILELPKNHICVIHSSMLAFGIFEGGLGGTMKCLHEVLGDEATILMPAFTSSFGKTRHWDYHSKAETGALAEYSGKLRGILRTIHSFLFIKLCGSKGKGFRHFPKSIFLWNWLSL